MVHPLTPSPLLPRSLAREEIDYVMMCVDANQDGRVDFNEFTDRFHNPAKDIGFSVAVLLTNLSEHIPNDPRLERFLEKAKCVLDYFEPYLGRIEIIGGAGYIERVYFEISQSHIDQWRKPQIQESKRTFLHNIVSEEGDKGKLEFFINFCEDSIFEMQLANSISSEEQTMALQQHTAQGPDGKETSFRYAWRHIKSGVSSIVDVCSFCVCAVSPANLSKNYRCLRSMSCLDIAIATVKLNFNVFWYTLKCIFFLIWGIIRFVYILSVKPKDSNTPEDKDELLALEGRPKEPKVKDDDVDSGYDNDSSEGSTQGSVDDENEDENESINTKGYSVKDCDFDETINEDKEEIREKPKPINYGKIILSIFARNFFNFKVTALALAFIINFLLLLFQVNEVDDDAAAAAAAANSTESIPPPPEWITLPEHISYLGPLLRLIAVVHTAIAFSLMVAYYFLKVPLVLFKREKEVCRSLEFDGLWIAEQPADDDVRGHWDKLVISTRSFPDKYWDKFVKKKVRNRYSEQYDLESITALLGMSNVEGVAAITAQQGSVKSSFLPSFISDIDWKYEVWKWGIIFTDNSFLYTAWYFTFSVLGHWNYFFFAAHLLDVAICFKTLGTILQSVTHNGRQLLMTVMLTSIVVYIYTVVAFNFFRKFYNKGEDGETDYKCHDMFTCYVFHLYVGVRAGGGIGDEIDSPDGDPSEVYRILFDITFFFFVIVILLAIIQGLIIDAFGELRDQLAQVQEDLESSCFICGIGKDYFDNIPHGFDTHVTKEHNFANYMFFLMHLINKPDTEYTGQETYVWELYQQRCWDFFPVGESFRKHYEEELQTIKN